MKMLLTPLCCLDHTLWSFQHSVDLMSDILGVSSRQTIFFQNGKSLSLWAPANVKPLTTGFFWYTWTLSARASKELYVIKTSSYKPSDKFNLNWLLISFKISRDDMKGSFFDFRRIAWSTTLIVFLTRDIRFKFSITLLCLLSRKWSRF